jgi:hypothetical protein
VVDHAFGIKVSHVRKICSEADKKQKPPYQPLALDEDQTVGVLAFIRSGYSAHNNGTQRVVLGFIKANYSKCLTYQ